MDSWFLWLGRNARLVALAVGSSVLVSLLCVGSFAVVRQKSQAIESEHHDTFKLLTEIAQQSDQLLTRLKQEDALSCDQETLKRLRGMLFQYRYLKEVGLINDENQLYCTTSQAEISPKLQLDSSGMRQKNGDLIKFQVPILATDSRVKATIFQRKNINVVVEPNLLDSINNQIDVAWFKSSETNGIAYFAETTTREQLSYLKTLIDSGAEEGHETWSSRGLIVTTTRLDSPIILQTIKPWADIVKAQQGMVLVIVALAALTALLSATATETRLRKYLKLKARIHRLLDPRYIVCMYQPIIELVSGKVVGCEVLARLRDGDQIQLPETFIPAVLERELSWELDEAVSKKAIAELLHLLPMSEPFRLALNFFPENIRSQQLHSHFESCLCNMNHPNLIVDIEITEYSMSTTAVKEARLLQAHGYHVSIDDFGTGYSNLKLLGEVQPDVLKIDKSFVFDMEDNSLRSNLIPQMVSLARAVGAKVVAEGVENEKQARQLNEMGIEFAQGYLYSRPVPVNEFIRFCGENWISHASTDSGTAVLFENISTSAPCAVKNAHFTTASG